MVDPTWYGTLPSARFFVFSLDWIHSTPINVFLGRESARKRLIDLSRRMIRPPLFIIAGATKQE